MINAKSNRLAIYNFKNSMMHMGATYLWYLGIVVVVPIVMSLILNGRLPATWQNIFGPWTAVAVFYTVADGLIFNYDNFKWSIQNGISRRTAWVGRIKGLGLLCLVALLISLVQGVFSKDQVTLYGDLFGTPAGFEWVVAIIFDFLLLFSLATTFLAIGYGLALLSKRGKLTAIIGIPIISIIILIQLVKAIGHLHPDWEKVASFARVVLGYSDKTGFNPVNITLIVVVWLAITLSVSYFFSSKMKLRRD